MEVLFSWEKRGKYGYKVSNLRSIKVSMWIQGIRMKGFLFNGKARGNLKKIRKWTKTGACPAASGPGGFVPLRS